MCSTDNRNPQRLADCITMWNEHIRCQYACYTIEEAHLYSLLDQGHKGCPFLFMTLALALISMSNIFC